MKSKDSSNLKPRSFRSASAVDEYLAAVPAKPRATLKKIRKTIREMIPEAEELLSYQMPTFKHKGLLVSYAAFSDHCSFFPLGSKVLGNFEKELSGFDRSKGTIRFTPENPLPLSLIKKIVKARIAENERRTADKERKKQK